MISSEKIISSICKNAVTIDIATSKEIDQIESKRQEFQKKIDEIKKENESTINEMSKTLEKIGYESHVNHQVFSFQNVNDKKQKIYLDEVNLIRTIFGPPEQTDTFSKIEKQLFDLKLDEEFTILEIKLKKQFNTANKINKEYKENLEKDLYTLLYKFFSDFEIYEIDDRHINNNVGPLEFWDNLKRQLKFMILAKPEIQWPPVPIR